MSHEDARVAAARVLMDQPTSAVNYNVVRFTLGQMINAYDERLRVNVGLVAENAELRRQVRGDTKPPPDLAEAVKEAVPILSGLIDVLQTAAKANYSEVNSDD
jgi:hypothetical protein